MPNVWCRNGDYCRVFHGLGSNLTEKCSQRFFDIAKSSWLMLWRLEIRHYLTVLKCIQWTRILVWLYWQWLKWLFGNLASRSGPYNRKPSWGLGKFFFQQSLGYFLVLVFVERNWVFPIDLIIDTAYVAVV